MSGKARRGNGEGSVYQDTKGVWHAKLNLGRYKNGKRRFKEFQGKRKADVIARLNSYRREYGDLSLESGANMSFADYITRWLENVSLKKSAARTPSVPSFKPCWTLCGKAIPCSSMISAALPAAQKTC